MAASAMPAGGPRGRLTCVAPTARPNLGEPPDQVVVDAAQPHLKRVLRPCTPAWSRMARSRPNSAVRLLSSRTMLHPEEEADARAGGHRRDMVQAGPG